MEPCPWPSCSRPTAAWLEGCSHDSAVDYFRCGDCGHVFTVPKGEPGGKVMTIFPGRPTTPSDDGR